VVGNSAAYYNGGVGGCCSTLTNCIIYYNTIPSPPDSIQTAYNSCVPTAPYYGTGNITNASIFVDSVDGDFRLQSNSPCINAGYNASATATTDLTGNPRIAGGTVDIGAYEFQSPASVLSYAWALRYGLPTDGSADFVDGDGDGHNNWQEWRAGTVPNDSASVLRLFSPTNGASGLTIRWQSVTNRIYWLDRATNLPSFSTIATNLAGQSGTTSFLDTSATNSKTFFYRVGAKE